MDPITLRTLLSTANHLVDLRMQGRSPQLPPPDILQQPQWLAWAQRLTPTLQLQVAARLVLYVHNPAASLQLSGLPLPADHPLPDLAHLVPGVRRIELRHCGLRQWPRGLQGLSALQELSLNGNLLRELPDLGTLQGLRHLDLGHNKLRAFPREVLALSSLQELNLEANAISELPLDIDRLASLRRLQLDTNPLEVLPDSLRRCRDLKELALDCCELKEVPAWIGEMSSLRTLVLGGNTLLDDLPQSMAQLHPECFIHLDRRDPFLPVDLTWRDGRVDPAVFEEPMDDNLPGEPQPLHEAVAAWQAAAGVPPQAGAWERWAGEDGAAAFAEWLQRLLRSYTFRNVGSGTLVQRVPAGVAEDMGAVLARMAQHPAFRKEAFALAVDALGHCSDRLVLGLSRLQTALLKSRVMGGELAPARMLEAGRMLFRRHALEDAARAHARRHRVEDEEVQVMLALETGLRDRLQLPRGPEKMNFRGYAQLRCKVDAAALEGALQQVRRREADDGPQGLWGYLAGQGDGGFVAWRQYLESRHAQAFQDLNAALNERLQDDMQTVVSALVERDVPEGRASAWTGRMVQDKWAAAERRLVRGLSAQVLAQAQGDRSPASPDPSSSAEFAGAAAAARVRDRRAREAEMESRPQRRGAGPGSGAGGSAGTSQPGGSA